MMDPQERLRRAREAERLVNEPLLVEALDKLETKMVEDAIALPSHAFLRRHLALAEVRAVREVRTHLKTLIMDGQSLSRPRPQVA